MIANIGEKVFVTPNGFVFTKHRINETLEVWHDGDLSFDIGPDDWPVNANGERIAGEFMVYEGHGAACRSERRSDEDTARRNAAIQDGGWRDRTEE
jgi:hypothetical protein